MRSGSRRGGVARKRRGRHADRGRPRASNNGPLQAPRRSTSSCSTSAISTISDFSPQRSYRYFLNARPRQEPGQRLATRSREAALDECVEVRDAGVDRRDVGGFDAEESHELDDRPCQAFDLERLLRQKVLQHRGPMVADGDPRLETSIEGNREGDAEMARDAVDLAEERP